MDTPPAMAMAPVENSSLPIVPNPVTVLPIYLHIMVAEIDRATIFDHAVYDLAPQFKPTIADNAADQNTLNDLDVDMLMRSVAEMPPPAPPKMITAAIMPQVDKDDSWVWLSMCIAGVVIGLGMIWLALIKGARIAVRDPGPARGAPPPWMRREPPPATPDFPTFGKRKAADIDPAPVPHVVQFPPPPKPPPSIIPDDPSELAERLW